MQQTEALDKGRDISRQRAAFKRKIKAAEQPRQALAAVLDDLPEFLATMVTHDFVRIAPHLGDERALKLLERAEIRNPIKPLGELTDRQRGLLAFILASR